MFLWIGIIVVLLVTVGLSIYRQHQVRQELEREESERATRAALAARRRNEMQSVPASISGLRSTPTSIKKAARTHYAREEIDDSGIEVAEEIVGNALQNAAYANESWVPTSQPPSESYTHEPSRYDSDACSSYSSSDSSSSSSDSGSSGSDCGGGGGGD